MSQTPRDLKRLVAIYWLESSTLRRLYWWKPERRVGLYRLREQTDKYHDIFYSLENIDIEGNVLILYISIFDMEPLLKISIFIDISTAGLNIATAALLVRC